MGLESPPYLFLLAVLQADPSNASDPIYDQCPTCRAFREAVDADQLCEYCFGEGCGLRDSASLGAEQVWLGVVWKSILQESVPPKAPTADALAFFNRHIALAGCLLPQLAPDGEGGLQMTFLVHTLRAKIHATLVQLLRGQSGYIEVNAISRATNAEVIRAEVGRTRERFAAHRVRRQQLLAAHQRDQGRSDNQIAKQVGVTNKTIRDWLGKQEDWQRNRENWYRRNGHPLP